MVKSAKWNTLSPGLTDGELPLPALRELTGRVDEIDPLGDTISLWRIDDTKSNLDRVVAAVCGNRNTPSHFDYLLIDEAEVSSASQKIVQSKGFSADDFVNKSFHFDATFISATKLVGMANRCLQKAQRILEKDMLPLVRKALDNKYFEAPSLSEGMKARLNGV